MPIPPPKKGETQKEFIPRCASIMAKSDPDKPNKQRIAMCYSKWEQVKESQMDTHKKAIGLAEAKKYNDFKKIIERLLASKATTALDNKKYTVAEGLVKNVKSTANNEDE